MFRVQAIRNVIEWSMRQHRHRWADKRSLTLTAAATLMQEALVSRPSDRPEARAVLHAVMHTMFRIGSSVDRHCLDVGAPEVPPPKQYFNLYFLGSLKLTGTIECEEAMVLGDDILSRYFTPNLEEVASRLLGMFRVKRSVPDETRSNNKRKRTTKVEVDDDINIIPAGMMISLHPAHLLVFDRPDSSDSEAEMPTSEGKVNELFRQLLADLVEKRPNTGRSSYFWTDVSQDKPIDLFNTEKLQNVFRAVTVKHDKNSFMDAIKRLVPDYGKECCTNAQGFQQSRYYVEYMSVRRMSQGRKDGSEFQKLREVLILNLKKLAWLPLVKSDRIWDTRQLRITNVGSNQTYTVLPEGHKGPCPQIVLNPRNKTIRNAMKLPRDIKALREEEEEEEMEKVQEEEEEEEY